MPHDQAGSLELREHAVNGGKPRVLTHVQQRLVHVLGAHVLQVRVFQNFQDAQPRAGGLQPRLFQILRFAHVGARSLLYNYSILNDRIVWFIAVMAHRFRVSSNNALLSALCLGLAVLSGCSSEGDRKLPGVYRVDVQQGNIIQQEMLDKLRPGMDRNQVRFIMGTPAIADPFHADRWDYIFTLSRGGRTREQRQVTLHFKDDRLTHVSGDIVPGERKSADELGARAATVDVPLDRNNPGVFSRLFNALPFVGDDGAAKKQKDAESKQKGAAPESPGDGTGENTPAPQPQSSPDLPSP